MNQNVQGYGLCVTGLYK